MKLLHVMSDTSLIFSLWIQNSINDGCYFVVPCCTRQILCAGLQLATPPRPEWGRGTRCRRKWYLRGGHKEGTDAWRHTPSGRTHTGSTQIYTDNNTGTYDFRSDKKRICRGKICKTKKRI